jgi:hypothetical protein
MVRKYSFTVSRNHLIAVGVALTLLVSGSAFGLNVGNTPDTGYLLCSNLKTHSLIYPAKLTCPSGYVSLQLGAQGQPGLDGSQGLQGPMGPQGSPGTSGGWSYHIAARDVVGPASATTWSGLKRFVVADISKNNLNGGSNYHMRASLSGQWSPTSPVNSYLDCYFQQASDYPGGSTYYGAADTYFTNWTGITLNVFGEASDYALGQADIYLVCVMSGSISGLEGYLDITSTQTNNGLALSSPPSI